MRFVALAAPAVASVLAAAGRAQGSGPWRMLYPPDWGMWLGPRDIVDERNVRGAIDRDGYLRRRNDIAGRC